MTVGVAWIRRANTGDELWMATDSRLSGDGSIWDACPKLMLVPRSSTAAAFAGDTARAYPLLLQVVAAVAGYAPAADGSMEWHKLVGHLGRVVTSLMASVAADPRVHGAAQTPGRDFASGSDTLVLGGFSRLSRELVIDTLRYSATTDEWRFGRIRPVGRLGKNRTITVFGDRRAKGRYTHLLKERLRLAGRLGDSGWLQFEPLEVLSDLLRRPPMDVIDRRLPLDARPWSIGGPPQVVRILPGAEATPFIVRWPLSDGGDGEFLLGRQLLAYEHIAHPRLTFNPGGGVALQGMF